MHVTTAIQIGCNMSIFVYCMQFSTQMHQVVFLLRWSSNDVLVVILHGH